MAAGWVHATMDLMAFGRSYFDLHKYKDYPWKELSFKHRKVHHDWYNEFGKSWNFEEPFPSVIQTITDSIIDDDEAEKFQSWVSHDYLDRIWDTLNKNQRRNVEIQCKYFLENPEELNRVYQIDVIQGLIYRVINGEDVIENCPQLIEEYKRLRKYVAKVQFVDA